MRPQFIADYQSRLLRIVVPDEKHPRHVFTPIYYLDLERRQQLRHVRISLRARFGDRYPLQEGGTVVAVLHVRRKPS